MNRFGTRVLTEIADLRSLSPVWTSLWERCSSASPFQHPAWLLPWIEVFRPSEIAAVEVRHGKELVGFAPLLVYPRESERVLAFMGGGVSDYLDLLVDAQWQSEVVAVILDSCSKIDHWTTLDLTDLPANSVLHTTELAQATTQHDKSSALQLPQARDELLHLLSKRQRANLRNAHSRIERAGGGQIETATSETLPEFLDDLFRLHTSRWSRRGQLGVLADEAVKAFHYASAPGLLASGMLHLYRLRLRDRTLAVLYSLCARSTVFCYLQGFDPEFASVSPGTQLMFSVMECALQWGIRKFDLLRGEEAYKRHWRAQTESTYRIELPRSALDRTAPLQIIAA